MARIRCARSKWVRNRSKWVRNVFDPSGAKNPQRGCVESLDIGQKPLPPTFPPQSLEQLIPPVFECGQAGRVDSMAVAKLLESIKSRIH